MTKECTRDSDVIFPATTIQIDLRKWIKNDSELNIRYHFHIFTRHYQNLHRQQRPQKHDCYIKLIPIIAFYRLFSLTLRGFLKPEYLRPIKQTLVLYIHQ